MDSIEAAFEVLELQKSPNYTKTTKEFNINRIMLLRCYRQITQSKADGNLFKLLLSPEQERYLVKYINKLTNQGIPPTNIIV